MANATVETGGLDWGDFRALEYFAIIYDIAIDEEQYNPKWCRLEVPTLYRAYVPGKAKGNAEPWVTDPYLLFPDNSTSPGDLPDVTITASLGSSEWPLPQALKPPEKLSTASLTLPAPRPGSEDQVPTLWRKLLLAKYVRANLQKDGSTTALQALDRLGIALLRAMPLLEYEIKWDESNKVQTQSFILKILFLNEAAACCRDYQSISLSDDCLNLIKNVVGEGKTPYELVALYNKAQGYLHIREYDDALREFETVEFEKVDKETSDKQKNSYFNSDTSDNSHLRWPGQEKLFAAYVVYPSVLQYADALLNLQRSWEARKRLDRADTGRATAYQIARRRILMERVENDRSPGQIAPDWPVGGGEPDNLTRQRRAVNSERALAKCKLKTADAFEAVRSNKPSDATDAIAASLVEFGNATETLLIQMERGTKNRSKIDAACFSWARGLSACKDLISFALSNAVGDCRNQQTISDNVLCKVNAYFKLGTGAFVFSDITRGLCTDDKYRDHAVEVRKTLIKNLYSIQDLRNEVKPERISNGFPALFKQIGTCLEDLLDGLIKKRPRSISEIEFRSWQEQKTLLDDKLLPGEEGEDPAARHQELRKFISHGFVHQADRDVALDFARRKTEQREWKDCKTEYQCFSNGQPSKECGKEVLDSNPSFTSENGSNALHRVERLVRKKRNAIQEQLYTKRKHDSDWHFVVLQRWNSYTPAMRASEGGGYFLYHAGKHDNGETDPDFIDVGVVIDPGYGFVKNFFSEGFGVCDITAIVITHDHPDHLADVGSLVNLLVEVRKNRGGAAKKSSDVEMLLSRGAFESLNPLIEGARDIFRDTVVLEPERTVYDVADKKVLFLKACRALHRDASDLPRRGGFDSVGLIAEIRDGVERKWRIGIPSDTKWDEQISREFTEQSRCDLICLHLGSITPEKFPLVSYFDKMQTSRKVLYEKQQLYLPGVVWYLDELLRKDPANGMPTLVILSEFGEELAEGVRIDIAKRLQAYADEKKAGRVVVLPGDVGLRVTPACHGIRCSCCHLEHAWTTSFHCETSGSSEQIFYVCPRCLRNLTQQERAERFANHHPSLPGTKS